MWKYWWFQTVAVLKITYFTDCAVVLCFPTLIVGSALLTACHSQISVNSLQPLVSSGKRSTASKTTPSRWRLCAVQIRWEKVRIKANSAPSNGGNHWNFVACVQRVHQMHLMQRNWVHYKGEACQPRSGSKTSLFSKSSAESVKRWSGQVRKTQTGTSQVHKTWNSGHIKRSGQASNTTSAIYLNIFFNPVMNDSAQYYKL